MNCMKKQADHDCYKCPCAYIDGIIKCGRCEYSRVIQTGVASCMLPRCKKEWGKAKMKANYEKSKRDKELDNIAFKKCKRGGYTMIGIDLANGKDQTATYKP